MDIYIKKEDYSTGLGLAIVKQIIYLHQGEIYTRLEDNRIYFEIVHKMIKHYE